MIEKFEIKGISNVQWANSHEAVYRLKKRTKLSTSSAINR